MGHEYWSGEWRGEWRARAAIASSISNMGAFGCMVRAQIASAHVTLILRSAGRTGMRLRSGAHRRGPPVSL